MSEIRRKNSTQKLSRQPSPARQTSDSKQSGKTKAAAASAADRLDQLPVEMVNNIISQTVAEWPIVRAFETLDALSKANPRAAAAIAQHPHVLEAREDLDKKTAKLTLEINKFLRSKDPVSPELKRMLYFAERVIIAEPPLQYGQRSREALSGYKVQDLLARLGRPQELVIKNIRDCRDIFRYVKPEQLVALVRLDVSDTDLHTTDFRKLTKLLQQAAQLGTLPVGPLLQKLNLANSCKGLYHLIADEDVYSFLPALGGLRNLNLGGMAMDVAQLAKHVQKMPQLESLSVPNTSWSTNQLDQFFDICGKQLKELNLRRNGFNSGIAPGMPERGGPAHVDFAKAPNLEALILSGSAVDAKWLKDANITACDKLRFLSVAWTDVTHEELEELGITRLPQLERLSYGQEPETINETL